MFKIGPKMTEIDPKMSKIRQIYPKISKNCINYCKNPTYNKKHGTCPQNPTDYFMTLIKRVGGYLAEITIS